jgi:hypothetical protein
MQSRSQTARFTAIETLEPRLLLEGSADANTLQLFDASPALFVENQGQWADASIRYGFQSKGGNVLFTDAGPVFQLFGQTPALDPADPFRDALAGGKQTAWVSVTFDSANQVSPIGSQAAGAKFNYLIGDQSTWRSDVPSYQIVEYPSLYDGVNLRTWGRQSGLKYEFHVAPGADYQQIQVSYQGIEGLSLDAQIGRAHV